MLPGTTESDTIIPDEKRLSLTSITFAEVSEWSVSAAAAFAAAAFADLDPAFEESGFLLSVDSDRRHSGPAAAGPSWSGRKGPCRGISRTCSEDCSFEAGPASASPVDLKKT